MNWDMVTTFGAGLLRHGLTTFGGYLVSSGVLQSSDLQGFVGAGMVIVGVLWSWWQKAGQEQVGNALKKLTGKRTVASATAAAAVLPAGSAITTSLPTQQQAAAALRA